MPDRLILDTETPEAGGNNVDTQAAFADIMPMSCRVIRSCEK